MGMHRQCGNKKKTNQEKRMRFKHRMKVKDRMRDKGQTKPQGEVQDPELVTTHILKKRKTSPKANITLSGKKKRKLIKQLKNMAKDKQRHDPDEDNDKEETTKPADKVKKAKFRDVEMGESETPGGSDEHSTAPSGDAENVDDVDMDEDDT